MAVGEDAASLASGRDTSALGGPGWTPVKVGRVLKDLDTVTLGGTTLTAHLTAGHTKGCTTWTTSVTEGGRALAVVLVGGTSINQGVRLTGNTRHPQIAADYARTFEVLEELKADIFLAQHPSMFRMEDKVRSLRAGGAANPFIDRNGYLTFVATGEASHRKQLEREKQEK
jgi:metallo-beta-lactamase class B